ncbi:MAG: [LysW]-lysine hydrolase [Chloroflexi bacterium]|nr:[LysW]-lysine hydrolase [Chloroflexota bacterium]
MSSQSNADEIMLLREMLEIYSPTGQEEEISAYLVGKFRALGFRAHQDSVGNVIGSLGNGDSEIVLLGHMDTVGGFLPVRQLEGQLYGRGAVDAKGPLAAFIAAAARVGALPGKRITVIGVVEEESSSRGARSLVGNYAPQCVIIGEPSHWEHITLGYKGRLLVRYLLSSRVRHSSAEGPSASERAVNFWNAMVQYIDELNGGERNRFHTLDPFLKRITSSDGAFAEEVVMDISLRVPFGVDIPAFKEKMRSLAGEAAVGFSGEDVPYRESKNNPLVRAFLKAIRKGEGEPMFKLKLGTSDMNTVGPVWQCPIVAYGPGDSSLDHTPDEHVDIGEYMKAIDVLSEVLRTL